MAEVTETPKSPLDRFQMVTRLPRKVRGQSLRDPEGANIKPTGVVLINTAGTELFNSLALEQKLDINKYGILFGGDSERGQAVAIVVDLNTPGATPVRRLGAKNTVTVYMTELFQDQPKLRPTSPQWCMLSKETDGNGGHFILFHLNVALERATSRRKQSDKPASDKPASEKPATEKTPEAKPTEGAAPSKDQVW